MLLTGDHIWNFQTIQSILNFETIANKKLMEMYFQTIQSILNSPWK